MVKKVGNGLATKVFVKKQINGVNERIDIVNSKVNELNSKFDEKEKKDEGRYNNLIEQLVGIAGQFKKFDEERVVIADSVRKHEDRLESLEKVVFKSS